MSGFSSIDLEMPLAHDIYEEYEVEFHLHDKCEIYFPISSGIKYFVEKNVYEVSYGDLIITNEREIHRPVVAPGQKYEKFTFLFSKEGLEKIFPNCEALTSCFYNRARGEHNKLILSPDRVKRVRFLFETMENLNRGKFNGELRGCLLVELLIEIATAYEQNFPFDKEAEPPLQKNDKMLNTIVEYVSSHLDDTLSLDEIANELFISKYHLLRTFKSATGTSLHRFIVMRRLEKARTMLVEQPDVSIAEIAGSCGFGDISNFVEQFKKASNSTPSVFRKTYGKILRRDEDRR